MKKTQTIIFQNINVTRLKKEMNDWISANDVTVTHISQSSVLDERFPEVKALTTITLLYHENENKNEEKDKRLLNG